MKKQAKGFRTLNAWKKAYELTLEIYRLSKKFPKEETYALASQLQRAAISVPANIAEDMSGITAKNISSFFTLQKGPSERLRLIFFLQRISVI